MMNSSMKRLGIRLVCLFLLTLMSVGGYSKDIVVKNGNWKITYEKDNGQFRFDYKIGRGKYKTLVKGSKPEATYEISGKSRNVNTMSFGKVDKSKESIENNFGKGLCWTFVFSNPKGGDDIQMQQKFYFYEDKPYFLTDLTLKGEGICSNYLAPLAVSESYRLYAANELNRMLKVPFDNDGFVRYHKYHIDGEMISYEVASLYEGESRQGFVVGSVEHDHWKSAVSVKASAQGQIDEMKVFSGVSNSETRDILPHGKITGPEVRSALMFVGYFEDWRTGMETYADANTLVQPKRDSWPFGVPFGWQSWGVMSDKNSLQTDIDVADYFAEELQPAGFCSKEGINIISIDAWDNLSPEQKVQLNKVCEEHGQIAGTYCTPFALWWNEDMLDRKIDPSSSDYTGWDCVLKMNGKPYKLDGAFCLDPTHPGVKAMMSAQIRKMKEQGFKYVKVDFISNGMVQADSYYNPNVKTAVEAFNEGMSHFIKETDKGEPMFVALSIAPVFPYQYGNSRRIACDTWGKIGQTEYSMNAISGGWWTDRIYQYNDPDHLVLVGNDEVKETESENRARVTNGAVSGMLLVADNYSLNDRSGRGNAVLSRERAKSVLMNKAINEIGNIGRSFRPVFGYAEYNGKDDAAETCFMYHTPEYLYVAVFNYQDTPLRGAIPFDLLEITENGFTRIQELWTNKTINANDGKLLYEVPAKDARVYRFEKR